jgi:signal peptidase I
MGTVAAQLAEPTTDRPGAPSRTRTIAYATAAVVLGLLITVRLFVAEPMRVPSVSMAPTLRPGDHVLIDKVAEPRRGDLAVFTHAGNLLLKRVVAVGGDQVGIENGELVVNGRTVDEPYVDHRVLEGVYFGPVAVPSGAVFVMGDNRTDSVDSRASGPVPRGAVVGRVALRLWPDPRGF